MQRTSSPLLAAALVAALVSALVGGGVSWLVVHWDEVREPGISSTRGSLDADVRVPLACESDTADIVFDVPDDVVALRVAAESSGGPLVLHVRFDDAHEAADENDDAWDEDVTDKAEEVHVDLAEHVHAGFGGGRLTVRVEAARHVPHDEALVATVRVTPVRSAVETTIPAGGAWKGATEPASGFRRTIAVTVPAGAKALRIDVADAESDLDLEAAVGSPVPWLAESSGWRGSLGAAEWWVLDGDSEPALPQDGGTVYVTVVDPSLHDFAVPFHLYTTLGRDPPPALQTILDLPDRADPRERALLSVVELLTDGGGGSGTLVTADGLILTARHVVEAAARAVAAGHPDDAPPIVVAVSLDQQRIARDLFLAEVVHDDRDLDLAMLRIVSGVRGTPLPDTYRFPCVALRRRSTIYLGETLWTLGYPAAGGIGTRAPITLSRGTVSGFDHEAGGLRIKTDAFVSPGSSGGAALDDRWELAGVPVSTMDGGTTGTVLGNLVPVDLIPRAWWR